ncbi:type I restriction endonuclease subunit R [uncultured Pseudokineococcus sp.]|uniref:type I restriction endonuclease subunit R n=1 Tax=uncultured Pseudokineococcus sp. TaxID=1642928 RepID=UPI0026058960|nr:type I restriction endonuclease subunit R [uncultured Pseudokineococcus sp.]
MGAFVAESGVEEACLEYFSDAGWDVLHGPEIGPGQPRAERASFRDVLLEGRLRQAVAAFNRHLPADAVDRVVATVRRVESADVMAENWRVHRLVTQGVPVDFRDAAGELRHDIARLVDFDDALANDFVAVNQVSVEQDQHVRRPDVLAYVNGLPLGVVELKAPGQPGADLRGAWKQLGTYTAQIPALMSFTAVSVISTALEARLGALGGRFEHHAPWKTVDGTPPPAGQPELEVLVHGVFTPARFLDLVRSFVVFTDEREGLVKRIAKYHQVHAVNRAVAATLDAVGRGDGRAGVVWHTQGSGKSLEMLFYVGKIVREPAMANPTAVLLTDRNDLDDQLYSEVFAPARTLPEEPVQAESREHVRQLLGARASGGIVFSTMQKFGLTQADRDAGRRYPMLSDRRNVVVIADEAHRTQYDLIDGLARNLRDALPRAAFIGFTGTPIEAGDRNTRAVFGDYIDVYDLTQAVRDEATVRVYYEARLAKVELPEEVRSTLDDAFAEATEGAEDDARHRLKNRWARVEAVVGARDRIRQVAADLVEHWEARRGQMLGKAMVVCMSRRICVDLYDEIVALRPQWHSDDDADGALKVVITGSAADGPEMARHVRSKQGLRDLKDRAKDPDDALQLVIVRDMWLTGFDSPSMHTMYVDKPMQGAGLMQAIARVNRTFRDKPGGLVVDYIGIAESLQAALADYTDRDRAGREVGAPVEEALALLAEKSEVIAQLLHGCAWREALTSGTAKAKLHAIALAVDHLLTPGEDLVDRFRHHTRLAAQAFSLVPTEPAAEAYRDDLAFFQAVAAQLPKGGRGGGGSADDAETETALRQVVSDAVSASGVVDIYAEAGLEKPDISIIDDDLADRLSTQPYKNLQVELLRRLLESELRTVGKINVVAERTFSEMLEQAMRSYTNRSLDAADIIRALVDLAKDLTAQRRRGEELGLRDDELAFYDAVVQNDSAVLELGDETLKAIARQLVTVVRSSTTVDWDKREQVRALLRSRIRRLLTTHKYPPDKQDEAVVLVLRQAEVLASAIAA